MAKGCVYITKDGKVFGSKETLAAHMNYTPALADMMAKYQKADGKMDVDSVTKWLTDNGYLKAEAKKPTTTGEDIKSFFSNIGNQNLAIMEADILKAGKSVISNISKATPEQRKKIDADIEQLKNKYPERNITSKVENGNLIVESGAESVVQQPQIEKDIFVGSITPTSGGWESATKDKGPGDMRHLGYSTSSGVEVTKGEDGKTYAVAFTTKSSDGKRSLTDRTGRPGFFSVSVKIPDGATQAQVDKAKQKASEQLKLLHPFIKMEKDAMNNTDILKRVLSGEIKLTPTTTAAPKSTEGTKKETPGISKSEQDGLEILNKYGVQRFTDWLTNQPLLGGFFGIRDIANKYGIKFPQTEKEFDAEVKKNGGIDNYMGSMADTFMSKMKQPSVEKKPAVKKEFPKAPVTDAVKAALKSVDNTTAAIMNLAKVLPTVYESIAKQVKLSIGKPASQQIAEAYHNAVENGVEPELVKAVENGVALQEQMKSKPSLADNIETNETLEVDGVPTGTRASNKASIDALERKHSDNATKKAVIAAVKKAARTLKSVFPSMDIHIHEDPKQYAAAMQGLKGQLNSNGNFSYVTSSDGTVVGRIDINLSTATPKVVVHEVTHAILLKMFGDNSPTFLDFRNKIEKIISTAGNAKLSRFAAKYGQIGVEEIGQAEEYLAELSGILSDKETPLDYGVIRKVMELINQFVSTVTFDKFKPFQDMQDQKNALEFFNTIAQSIKAGSPVENLMTSEPYNSFVAIEVNPDGTFTKSSIKTKATIGDYFIPKGKKDLEIANVPTKSLAEVIKEYKGRVVIITSDATGYGVDNEGREIYGGPGFANNKKNVDDGIGYASLNIGTVKSTYTAAENIYGQGKTLVLIMVQPPHTTINNSYGSRYFINALVNISKNEDWPAIKADIRRIAEKNTSITKNFKEEGGLGKVLSLFDQINSTSDVDALTEEYLNLTTFQSRAEIAKAFMLKHPEVGMDAGSAKTKKAFLDIGVTIYDFLKEYGDQTILTEDMMREDIGGFVVAGFEIDVTEREDREKLINETQNKGIKHPLFNAKLPGTNHFVLDGLYGVNENFARFAKQNTAIALPVAERDKLVRETYTKTSNYDKPIQSKINAIAQDPALSDEEKNTQIEKLKTYTNLPTAKKIEFKDKYLSKIEGALVPIAPDIATAVAASKGGFNPIKGSEKKIAKAKYTISKELPASKIASKASLAYDETGFITTDSMINIVAANDPTYLGDVMNHILDMGEKLRSGNVGPKDLAKAYMMAVSSIQSKDQPVRNFENAIGEKVDEVFVEKERGTIRPEGAMAYLLTTPQGKRMLDNINQGKIDAKDRAFIANSMRPFGMYGEGQSKFNNLFGTTEGKQINLTNINEFADMLKGGVQDEQKFFNDITKLKGISQAKVGFVTNFLGIGTRGVIDTREIKGWLRGVAFMDDFTESEAAMNTQLTKSLKNLTPLQSEILRRMRVVGEAMNIDPALAEYIGHHMIWDAVKNERTTHDGLYLAMKQNDNEFADRLAEIKARPELKSKASLASVEETAKALDEVGEATVKAKIDSLSESLKKSFDQQKAKIEALGNASTDKDLESYTNLKSASRQIDRVAKYGSFPIGYDTIRDEFSDVDKQIEKPEAKYKNGKQIGKEDFGKTYEVEGSGLLYRGISKADYERINKQGFIDTDMRGAISRREGMNLAKDPATSASYLPNNAGGYVIAINPKGLNLFGTDADNYIRTRDVVPIENIVKVSEYIAKDDMGSFFMDSKLNESISNAYYKAKEDGSNPGLVKAVEDLIGKPELKSKASLTDNNAKEVADLYAEMREGGGWTERQKINAILDQDPKLSYIYNNFKAITQMLEEAELLTKSGNCP